MTSQEPSPIADLLEAQIRQFEELWRILMQSTIDPSSAVILQQLITTQRAILETLRDLAPREPR